jgi:hypothetical protein
VKLAVVHEVPLRGTFLIPPKDQAANLSEVLAWSFSLKSVLRTVYIFDVFPRTLIIKNMTSGVLQHLLLLNIHSERIRGVSLRKTTGIRTPDEQGCGYHSDISDYSVVSKQEADADNS